MYYVIRRTWHGPCLIPILDTTDCFITYADVILYTASMHTNIRGSRVTEVAKMAVGVSLVVVLLVCW